MHLSTAHYKPFTFEDIDMERLLVPEFIRVALWISNLHEESKISSQTPTCRQDEQKETKSVMTTTLQTSKQTFIMYHFRQLLAGQLALLSTPLINLI